MIYQVEFNSTISKNVIKAFQEIHDRGIYHGDVRVENILVRRDNSVVIIDFEWSDMYADEESLKKEMRLVQSLLAGLQKGHY
jgi:tRNA A-37 threonylcarbamoyl transferase component Bud32